MASAQNIIPIASRLYRVPVIRPLVRRMVFALAALLGLAPSASAADPNAKPPPALAPGSEIRLPIDDPNVPGGDVLVYVPSDYDEHRAWPAIFYYHGAGEQPATDRFRTATDGKGFIIVALEFVPPGDPDYLRQEQANLDTVVRHLDAHLKLDATRLVLAGVSRGGWVVSSLFDMESDPWKGVTIFCAGRMAVLSSARKATLRSKFFYVGAGETDPNLRAARAAAEYYRRRQAQVTFEVYPGLGHAVDPAAPGLRAWFQQLAPGGKDPKKK
jgi:predicted esterase